MTCALRRFPHCVTAIPDSVVEYAITAMERQFSNVVLVGMPGCGKSTLMRLLAEKTGKSGVDTDTMVEQMAGCTIPEIFEHRGEAAFRKIESEAVQEAGKGLRQIIATGGGAVLAEENRLALRQNATVVFLKRPLEALETAGRPLSQNAEALQRLYRERLSLYEAVADVQVEVDDNPCVTCEAVLKAIKE